jgi:hypothetical protein
MKREKVRSGTVKKLTVVWRDKHTLHIAVITHPYILPPQTLNPEPLLYILNPGP